MLFNKKELCLTTSLRAQAEIREVLKMNHIKYDLEVIDRNARGKSGTVVREGYKKILLYQFSVKKKDYEHASHLIQAIKLND